MPVTCGLPVFAAGRIVVAAVALPVIIVSLLIASLWAGAETWIILGALGGWLACAWGSPFGELIVRKHISPVVVAAVVSVGMLALAPLAGVLISDQFNGAEIGSYVIRSALFLWALGATLWAATRAATRPWRWWVVLLILVLPPLAVWAVSIWVVPHAVAQEGGDQ